jgi:hypothetical protein
MSRCRTESTRGVDGFRAGVDVLEGDNPERFGGRVHECEFEQLAKALGHRSSAVDIEKK